MNTQEAASAHRDPTHARLPDGSICPWNERLRTIGATPLWLENMGNG